MSQLATTVRTDPRAALMSEVELERNVGRIAADLQVWRHHNPDSRKVTAGLPDDLLAGPGGVIWRELKRETEKPSPAQIALMAFLRAAGHDVDVWRPSDLLSGRIAREILALSRARVAEVGA